MFGSVQAQAVVLSSFTDAQGRIWGNPFTDLLNLDKPTQAGLISGAGGTFASIADIFQAADTSNDAVPLTNLELETFMSNFGFFTSGCGLTFCYARLVESTVVLGGTSMTSYQFGTTVFPVDGSNTSGLNDTFGTNNVGAFWYVAPSAVPEPSALLMIGLGLMGAVGLRYRRH